MRICSKCKTEKPLDDFKKTKSGYAYRYSLKCLECKHIDRPKPNTHNLSKEKAQFLKDSQYNKCKICGVEGKLVIDHCHDRTKRIRGAICQKCNVNIGHLESILKDGLLTKMLDYLKPVELDGTLVVTCK